jgi:alpha-L-fucosidase
VRELLSKYGRVDVLWFDADGGKNTPETWGNQELFPLIRGLQPQIILTKRCGGRGDFDTPEQTIGAFNHTNAWETCMTLCRQWSWKPADEMKSLPECLRTLISCAGGDGNLLLNVGPMPDGRIEPRQVEVLNRVGAWMATNGESLYGTRGGPWKPSPAITSTRKGDVVYVHVLKPVGDSVELPALPRNIKAASVLGGGKVKAENAGGKYILRLPEQRGQLATVIRLELDGPGWRSPP